MKKICVFCGSSMGFNPVYREKAVELGRVLADNGCELLYGGGSVGLMKVIADVMLERGCKVTGTITQHLMDMHVGHSDIDEMIVVDSMAERKKYLEDEADGFIAMPGGIGTMDEFFEVYVLSQLRVFDKPVALFNVNGYYDGIVEFISHIAKEGFMRKEHAENLIVSDDPKDMLEKMKQFQPADVTKWVVEIKEQVRSKK
ncbi:MAG: TIGR00730 family Rossman fold protein [Bacteroidales bacterium]|nr:TIGR00730 family Rossman fold protein [Bacteroidales bacterium]